MSDNQYQALLRHGIEMHPDQHREGPEMEAALQKFRRDASFDSGKETERYLKAVKPLLMDDPNMNAEAKRMLANTEITGLAVAHGTPQSGKMYLLELADSKTHEARGVLNLNTGTVFVDRTRFQGENPAEQSAAEVRFWGDKGKQLGGVSVYSK